MRKYEIWMADFDPRKGHAQSGRRPCVVVQNNLFNAYSPTVMVVPLTSIVKKPFPSEFLVEPSVYNGLTHTSRFLGSQVMTLDKVFLHEKLGTIEKNYYKLVSEALSLSLDIENRY
ncbi:MAG TPA: type II toxin-antitoxin system PemK/MazF family toxin [Candidatus Absconditabacterales bacterium]|nr:type II toxin-antitoxin system PemK/MazF family toxin [Candidatus Absconditabacterales bacterium]HMT26803.1 type II toxin-antitoxin system PemK/MazF family toxin [Candidatus Absconditabacterales bacterium]